MKKYNPLKSLVLLKKPIFKKQKLSKNKVSITKNNNINNENNNIANNTNPKNTQNLFKSYNKKLEKNRNPRIILDTTRHLSGLDSNICVNTLKHQRYSTTSTNFSSTKNKHNKSISNNKRIQKKDFISLQKELESLNKNTKKNNHNHRVLERTRSGRKEDTQKTTPASLMPSNSDKNQKLNVNLNEKMFQNMLNTSKFNIEMKFNNKNGTIRTMNDIKKECLATMRVSEKVQNQIIDEGNKLMSSLEEKYFLLKNNKPIENLSLQENINNINIGFFSTNFINIEENNNSNNFSTEEYKKLLDAFNIIEYGSSILNEYFDEQENLSDVLQKHTITPVMRLKMVDWMIEIFTIIQTNDITFFNAVNIMDSFFYKSKCSYQPSDLHLIGICSIFIASKFCDINPIRLKFLLEKIGHGKFTREQIIMMEEKILSTLQYDLLKPTIYEFTTFFFQDLFSLYENNFTITNNTLKNYLRDFINKNSEYVDLSLKKYNFGKIEKILKYTNNLRNFVKCILIYLMKMCCQDYEIMKEKKPLIAAACIIVSMRICEEVNKDKYIDEFFLDRITSLSKENIYNIMELSSKILVRAQNYEQFYPGVKHLYKTHFENLSKIKITK